MLLRISTCMELKSHVCCVQGAAVADVASIWNCKKSVAKTLLMHYMWDKDKLMSECPSSSCCCAGAALHCSPKPKPASSGAAVRAGSYRLCVITQ